MTRAEAVRAGSARLRSAGVDDPAGDARRLLEHVLGDTLALRRDPDKSLSTQEIERFFQYLAARCSHQPVAQIIGQRAFFGHTFAVTPDTLDPRPETEELVARAIALKPRRVLDLGTGTGAILLSILAACPEATGTATDISSAALSVARRNAATLGLTDRATFLRSDWFDAVEGGYDLVVSNPPYLTAAELEGVAPDVRDWEPHLALSPGGDGLAAYRTLALGLRDHLVPKGTCLLEIGSGQGESVPALFAAQGFRTQLHSDLSGHPRIVQIEDQ
ncbi:MAG: peptide chain release factor N(5)-glutamine methyltransferase [Pseudomonadota bacterium]